MTDPFFSVDALSVWYGAFRALEGVSFTIEEGTTLAVVGANGAGKSSLARGICGLVRPRSGRIRMVGEDIAGLSAHETRRHGLAYMPEGRGIFRTLSVLDNLRLAASSIAAKRDRPAAIDEALELFPILTERRLQLAGTLSGGEQQMLALARVMLGRPRLLIADEVSLGLAPLIVDAVYERLDEARRTGLTLIIIEQFIHRALAFADQVVVLRRGQLVSWGPAGAISPEEILDGYIGERDGEKTP